ncbi:hypothetical protein AB0C84_07935 [Actinomadura sp. NPDC048955]|uniref:hypothetical protein n=1 Tax=Actinomadura sp. NPDC048955 TaxID=3158228 RepID=UPI003409F825
MEKLRLIAKNAGRSISANRRRLISLVMGALAGALVGGFIEVMDYAVLLADLHHRYGIDPFEAGNPAFLVYKAVLGACIGVITGAGGAYCSAFVGIESARMRKNVFRIALGTVIAGVAAAVACVALAASGVAVITLPGPIGGDTLVSSLGNLIISTCGVAAGVVVGAVRARD